MKHRDSADLQDALEYKFSHSELLDQALTHSSHARELETVQAGERAGDNEQLEFLGDAVLSLVTTAELFARFPYLREGDLSKLRAHLVSEKHLIRVAHSLGLGEYLRLGRGEEKSGGRKKTALLVDALEAILAAMYLDGGFSAVRDLILKRIVHPELELIATAGAGLPLRDYKSALQEMLQAKGIPQPAYVLVRENGPEHNKTFTVEVRSPVGGEGSSGFVGRAEGSTKKNAEQEAARQVLEQLGSSPEHMAARQKLRNSAARANDGPNQ